MDLCYSVLVLKWRQYYYSPVISKFMVKVIVYQFVLVSRLFFCSVYVITLQISILAMLKVLSSGSLAHQQHTFASWTSKTGVCRENSQRGATVSQPWTENTGGSSMSWPRCTAWRVWATTASPNATWSSQPRSKASFKTAKNNKFVFKWNKIPIMSVDRGCVPLLSGGRQPVQTQHWHHWLSARRLWGPLLPSLISNNTAASKPCFFARKIGVPSQSMVSGSGNQNADGPFLKPLPLLVWPTNSRM